MLQGLPCLIRLQPLSRHGRVRPRESSPTPRRLTRGLPGLRIPRSSGELGIEVAASGALRYQLFHRTVSALIEARRFTAPHALMLVHSFSPKTLWLDDYTAFAAALGVKDAAKDTISRVGDRGGVELFVGWCSGEQRWRSDKP